MTDGWKNDNGKTILSWIATVAMLGIAWPIGLFMLFRVLSTGSLFSPRRRIGQSEPIDVKATVVDERPKPAPRPAAPRAPRTPPAAQRLVPVKRKRGRGLMIAGGITSGIFAISLLSELADVLSFGWENYMLRGLFTLTGFFAAGLVMLGVGLRQRRQATRYRRYLTLIGSRRTLSIDALAKALPVPFSRACDDLQDMLERGHLPPEGYIDLQNHRLVLSPALEDEPPAPRKAPAPPKGDDAVLAEIRAINDEIADPDMSAKIDRIGEITARILDYQRKNPEVTNELQSFLDYYLPTTLKLLRSYERMEEQGVEGENIRSAKARIEDAMDMVVEGFEARLDKLFQADAIDVTSDIQVLEQMLQKDGLSEDGLLKF